jgi:CheY-like chemotaxis protein
LAEDEPLLLGLVSFELRNRGYRVLEAANGEEAPRVAEGHNGEEIHALVTDIVMPRMGGIELAERFKAMRQNAKVIFMSGFSDTSPEQTTEREVTTRKSNGKLWRNSGTLAQYRPRPV